MVNIAAPAAMEVPKPVDALTESLLKLDTPSSANPSLTEALTKTDAPTALEVSAAAPSLVKTPVNVKATEPCATNAADSDATVNLVQ